MVVRFPAAHVAVGEAVIRIPDERFLLRNSVCSAAVSVGDIVLQYSFANYDVHLPLDERATRVAGDVARFLRELFADRLLMSHDRETRAIAA